MERPKKRASGKRRIMEGRGRENIMKKIIHNLNRVLDRKQKINLVLLAVLVLIGGVLETCGYSLLTAVAAGIISDDNSLIRFMKNLLKIDDPSKLMMTMFGLLIVLFIAKNLFLAFLTYVQNRYICNNRNRMISNVLREFLNRPYEFYLDADIPTVFRITDSDIPQVFTLLLTLIQISTECVVGVMLGIVCLISSFQLTCLILIVLVVMTFGVTKGLKPVLNRYGEKNLAIQSRIAKWRIEAIYGIKDVKVLNREEFFASNYENTGKIGAVIARKNAVLNALPRLFIETVFIVALLFYMMIRLANGADVSDIGTQITVIGISATRLLPCASRINTYMAMVNYCEPCLDYLAEHMDLEKIREANRPEKKEKKQYESPLQLEKEIRLSDITYAYPNTEKNIFEHANMVIPKGKSVGIMGTSGAGKSTIVDILLGLLKVKEGEITCDGRNIFENYPSWLSRIGYIPQTIYLVDEPIRNNIAFGIDDRDIDDEEIRRALREAQLLDFVESLPEGIHTTIGDRGVRLSGGQRQRLGIARALYHNPSILVFDEATSALDNETETALMEAIHGFHGKKTMIIIAHRLNTIEKCDMIYKVCDGKIVETTL